MRQPYFLKWEQATDELARQFALKYFGKDYDLWWIADEIASIACINDDYFFDVKDMADFLRYNYTKKSMFEYYQYAIDWYENADDDSKLNIKNWRHFKV